MAISLTKLALGGAIVTILAVPALPAQWLPDAMNAPAERAIPQLVDGSARAANSFLVSAAMADEMPQRPAIDFSALVKISDADYTAYHDATISTEILSQTTVQKIGYGRKTNVSIVKTPTGTYSSDALRSPHVRYPGIEVAEDPDIVGETLGLFWQSGIGWVGMPLNPKGSKITYGRMWGGGTFISGKGSSCFSGPGFLTCS